MKCGKKNLRATRAEFVLLDLENGQIPFDANDLPQKYELQTHNSIQQRGPRHNHTKALSNAQWRIRRELDSRAAEIQRSSIPSRYEPRLRDIITDVEGEWEPKLAPSFSARLNRNSLVVQTTLLGLRCRILKSGSKRVFRNSQICVTRVVVTNRKRRFNTPPS